MVAAAVPEATRKMLATLWERNLPVVQGRVEELQRAAEAVKANNLSAEERVSAVGTAHKLAGSLGMFGYQRGTEIARELEQRFEGQQDLDAVRVCELAQQLRCELKF